MSEEMLIRYCAPTLAGIKTASLFTCPSDSKEELRERIRSANRQLLPRGIRLLPLRQQSGHALIYMYRPKRLERDLASQKAEAILARAHYPAGDPQRRLAELSLRLRQFHEFPHEIGLFLGYPPDDVEGFIENREKAFKCPGYWKVYGDEEKAKAQFHAISICTACYCRCYIRGMSLEKLAVREKAS